MCSSFVEENPVMQVAAGSADGYFLAGLWDRSYLPLTFGEVQGRFELGLPKAFDQAFDTGQRVTVKFCDCIQLSEIISQCHVLIRLWDRNGWARPGAVVLFN